MIGPILRAASYADLNVSPSVVAFSEKMMLDTPIPTLMEFLHALQVHDETAALPTLAKIPTLVVCGDHDLVTPGGVLDENGRRAAGFRAGHRRQSQAIWCCWPSRIRSTTGWCGWSSGLPRADWRR